MSRPEPAAAAGVLRRPGELDLLDLRRSAVIEASAGTGKTYLLEHLVLDLLITGRARLDEILVVTFTERATAELVLRIRNKIDQALEVAGRSGTTIPDPSGVVAAPATPLGWTLDDAARARLAEARRSFDQATISTIHAFCQRILTDEPLATRRLLQQARVDGRQIFGEVFRDVLRRELTTGDRHVAYLDAYLACGRRIEDLEELLYRASTTRGDWANSYDETALQALATALARLDLDAFDLEKTLRKHLHPNSVSAMFKRLRRLVPEAQAALAGGAWGRLLACFDNDWDIFAYFETIAALADFSLAAAPVLAPLHHVARLALVAAPPLDEAVAQRFLPLVETKLHERKLAEGLYDYDDMIRAVDEALNGPGGAGVEHRGSALIEKLRRRYKFALVDEAQDTEPAQWRIFRRVFLQSEGSNPVILIGDAKQAIYGFRGADVQTYVQAREDIRAQGGTVLPLARNFRSHPELVAATNAIFDHQAQPRYFSGEQIAYDHPVTAVKPPLGTGPGITLFVADPPADRGIPVRIGAIRQALRAEIATEIQRLVSGKTRPSLSEVHVLARSNAEAREMAACLHQAGIANVLFKPDDIFKSKEAAQVRALLLAIADPTDRQARLAAWLTPFFDVRIDDLANCADPRPDHPLSARLIAWNRLAEAHLYDQLWARILDDSGVVLRCRLSAAGLRRLTNYRHLFDVLHAAVSARPATVGDLAALLGTYASGRRPSAVSEDDTQRLETEADAVRIMTIHAAKGLEADYVFIYGGLTTARFWRGIHALQRRKVTGLASGRSSAGSIGVGGVGGGRLRCAGKPRRQADIDSIEAARHEEEQRLLYVALTRARKHLYLPFFPAIEAGDLENQGERGSGDFDPFKKISGEYRHVNQRLRALAANPAGAALFHRRPLAIAAKVSAAQGELAAAIAAWNPPPEMFGLGRGAGDGSETEGSDDPAGRDEPVDDLALLRVRRSGFAITSYSRLSDAEGGYRSPAIPLTDEGDESDDDDAPSDTLPGGLASGLFLHGILEKAPLGKLPPLAIWQAQPEVAQLIEAESRRWERDARHWDDAARMVHAALTVPITLPDGSQLSGLTCATRIRREVDFLFPLPNPATVTATTMSRVAATGLVYERGFLRGALDVLFQHGDRCYFADWKSNVLPSYSPSAIREHVASNYQLQLQIYTLAVVRMLGIATLADYDSRFGGLVYLFLRGLTGKSRAAADGLYVYRPEYDELERWVRDLADRRVAGAGGAW